MGEVLILRCDRHAIHTPSPQLSRARCRFGATVNVSPLMVHVPPPTPLTPKPPIPPPSPAPQPVLSREGAELVVRAASRVAMPSVGAGGVPITSITFSFQNLFNTSTEPIEMVDSSINLW